MMPRHRTCLSGSDRVGVGRYPAAGGGFRAHVLRGDCIERLPFGPCLPMKRDEGRSVFQTQEWALRTARCLPGHLPQMHYFQFDDGTEVIWSTLRTTTRGGLFRLEALPWGLYGRPLIRGRWTAEKGRSVLGFVLRQRCVEVCYVEDPLRDPLDLSLPVGVVEDVTVAETHVLDLADSSERMWNERLSKRIRNQVRRAEREGLSVRVGSGPGDVDTFYGLYESAALNWGYATPPFPKAFFHTMLEPQWAGARLVLAEEGTSLAGGGLFIYDEGSVLYWFGAMNPAWSRKFPMYALLWWVIRDAIERRIPHLNMGASGDLAGVREFKELWGGRPVQYRIRMFRRPRLIRWAERARRGLRLATGRQ